MSDSTDPISRRRFILAGGALALAGALPSPIFARQTGSGRLKARPRPPDKAPAPGLTRLWDDGALAFLHVPASYDVAKPIPLLIALHGAGGRSAGPLRLWTPQADAAGFALLVVESAGATWDAIRGEYGPDVASIDRALDATFSRVAVDPKRITLGGFSDGASYSLGLGLINGDLFPRVLACSPGFITRHMNERHGKRPTIFVSHGHQDPILPYDNCVDRVIPMLKEEGCPVEFHEFQGGHAVPPAIAAEAAKFVTR
jgi:phospholipase/carboxylesterase